eukprot:1151230-Pelagomonas_calceolata.AAC.4
MPSTAGFCCHRRGPGMVAQGLVLGVVGAGSVAWGRWPGRRSACHQAPRGEQCCYLPSHASPCHGAPIAMSNLALLELWSLDIADKEYGIFSRPYTAPSTLRGGKRCAFGAEVRQMHQYQGNLTDVAWYTIKGYN